MLTKSVIQLESMAAAPVGFRLKENAFWPMSGQSWN